MTETSKSWTVAPEEDPVTGDMIITFPLDLLEQTGWKEGDTLVWDMQENGSIHLTKKVEE